MHEITLRETIEELKLLKGSYPYPQTRYYKALSKALECVELQIPKPIQFEYNCVDVAGNPSGCPICPNCCKPVYDVKSCLFCGQKFIQSESEVSINEMQSM